MTKYKIIKLLNSLDDDDPENAHVEADKLLVEALKISGMDDIADAYCAAVARIGFWYS